MASLLLKDKFQIVKTYLNQIDPNFHFLTFPIVDSKITGQIKVVQLKPRLTLSSYKLIEEDLDMIIDLPFTSNQSLLSLAWKYIDSLHIDREVMEYN